MHIKEGKKIINHDQVFFFPEMQKFFSICKLMFYTTLTSNAKEAEVEWFYEDL